MWARHLMKGRGEPARLLVTDEPVEFEEEPVKVQDVRRINPSFLEESMEYNSI